jgi:signal transduction histidine kinase
MTAIIRKLLDYARPHPPELAPVDLRQLTRGVISLLAPLAASHQATICLNGTESPCSALADAAQVQQVVINLVVNALHAMPLGGQVELDISPADVTPSQVCGATCGSFLCLTVVDHGTGIDIENIKHIFDPFFTTKNVGEGTGLGLSIAYEIVREHGGWIDVMSQPGEGTRFSVYLPATDSHDESQRASAG